MANSKANSVNKRIQRATTKTTQSVPKAKPAQPLNNNALSAVANVNNALQRQQAEHAAIAQQARNRAIIEKENAKRTQAMHDAMNYLVTGQRPSINISAPNPSGRTRQLTHNADAANILNGMREQERKDRYSYLNDPQANNYILESFNRGNPLSKVGGGASSNARNDGMVDWAKDMVRNQPITDYINERTKNFTSSVEDFVSGYQNPYKQQLNDIDREALAYMTEDEQKEYSYLLGKDSINGTQNAKAFADSVRDRNVYKEAERRFRNYRDSSGLGRIAQDVGTSYVAGIDNAVQGATKRFGNFVTGKNEVEGPSVMENLYGMMSESAANSGNKLPVINHTPEEILQNIAFMQGNMAPSQLVGGAAGLAGLSQKIASAAGAAAMFPQVAGSAYNETLRDTGDVDKARLYALASGMNEAAGEYFLGGLEDVSGGFVQDWATKNLPKRLAAAEGKNLVTRASHALARALTHPMTEFLLNGAQEGVEEIVQGTVDAVLRNAILNENNEVNPLSEDNLYSAFVAALSVFGSNIGPAIANNVQRNAYGNQTMQVFRDMGYDYQTLADTMPVSEADYTSEYGLVDKQKLQDAQEAQALAQALATKEGAGARIKASENADLAEAISKVQDNYTEHMGNKLRAQDLELKPMRDAEMVENIRGGFDENGKTAFDTVSGDKIQKARPFAAYYNMGRFGTEVSENMQQTAREVGLTSEEMSSALRAGAADANNLFPTKASAEMKRIAKNIKAKGRKGSVKFDGVDYNSLTTQQKMRVDFSEALLTKGLGMDVIFVQSGVEDGKYQGANGAYQTINGRPTITLDVNAGMNYESDWTGQMTDIKTLLPTVSHELTHFLEKANKDAYQQIAQSVVGALQKSGKYSKGLSFNEILNEERNRLDNVEQRSHTNDDALHEIVARACEDMLSGNKQAMQAFENLDANTKKTISDHIKEIFDNIRDFFEQMLKEYRSGSAEARAIRSNMEEFEKIRDMWNEALNANYDIVHASEISESVDASLTGPEQAFSIRQFAQASDYDLLVNSEGVPYSIVDPSTGEVVKEVTEDHMRKTPIGVLVDAALQKGTITQEAADAQIKMFTDLMNLIVKYDNLPMVWEIAGSYTFSAVKTNADKQYSDTVDYGTICAKTQALIEVLSKTMVEKGRGLTREEVLKAYNETAKTGLSVPCPVCYVFSRWMGVPSLLENMRKCQIRFNDITEEQVQKYIKGIQDKYVDKDLANHPDKKKRKSASKQINEAKVSVQNQMERLERRLQDAMTKRDTAKQAEITKEADALQKELNALESYNWVTQVRCKETKKNSGVFVLDPKYKPVPNEILLDFTKSGEFARDYGKAWKYRTTRGAGMGKAIQPYSGHTIGDLIRGGKNGRYVDEKNPMLNHDKAATVRALGYAIERARKQNTIGGQRFQSTSDFRAEWGIDYLMTFLECQCVGSQVQLYTKVIEAVDLFASAGAEVNLSIMPKNDGYITLPDGSKKLVFSNVTGVDFDAAYEKVKQYDNVQMILVGINDDHIRLAMADDRIGFIIPWHPSGNSKETLASLMESVGEKLLNATSYEDYQSDKVIDEDDKVTKARRAFRKQIIQGKLWADYKSKKPAELTASQQAMLDENPYFNDLYERFYLDRSSQEYGLKLNGDQSSGIFPYEYWDKSLTVKDADENGRRFCEYCEYLGLTPRFSQFANDPGYWKLLIDRSMYNNDGTYHTPKAIDVTNVEVSKMPMAVNSNNYKDQGKIAQATMDTLMALDDAKDDLSVEDVDYTEIEEYDGEAVNASESANEENNPAYTGEYPNGKQFQHRVTSEEKVPGTNENLLKSLNKQIEDGDYITTYKAFLRIDDVNGNPTYYSPMASLEKDENGNKKLRNGIKLLQWLASDGKLTEEDIAKMKKKEDPNNPMGSYGYYVLQKSDEYGNHIGDVEAAYNPYQHSSDLVINDQFQTYYARPGVVVVECRIPMSEINNPYWAPYAKDPTGKHEWKSGSIARQLEKTERSVYMTRYIQPVRELSNREVAEKIRDIILKEDHWIDMHWNVMHPEVVRELESMGITIDPYGSNEHIKDQNKNITDRYGNAIPKSVRDEQRAERDVLKKARDKRKAAKAKAEKKAAKYSNKQYSTRDYAPTFYSKLQREIGNFKGDKIGAASVESYLKGKGVKDEEIKWSGIRQYLEGKKSVNKQELMDYLKANELVIEETSSQSDEVMYDDGDGGTITRSELEDHAEYWADDAGYSSYEIVPVDKYTDEIVYYFENGKEAEREKVYHAENQGDTRWHDYKLDGGENYREILFSIPGNDYSNSSMYAHWGKPGVLAHARVQDFYNSDDGGKVLFVEEIQSDWHNAGHKYGYAPAADIDAAKEVSRKRRELRANATSESEIAEANRRIEAAKAVIYKVAEAPFRDSYTNFVLKDLLRMAAEGDYDYLAWTTGPMQEERWSSDYAEGYHIEYDQDIPKFLKKYGKQWNAGLTNIPISSSSVANNYGLELRELHKILMEFDPDTSYSQVLDGAGQLEEATKYWIDSDAEDYERAIELSRSIDKAFKSGKLYGKPVVPAIVVNDAMKESVLYAGQPMFSQRNVDLDQRLDALVEKYGALPKGEKAVRDISVPEQTSDGKRVRRYARTVLESGITSDMMDEEIKEKILKEGLSYEPVTDESAAEYATSVLRIGGTAKAQKEWDRARRSDTFNKDAMAVGQELLREYAKQGDVENVVKMVTELAAEGTRMGQNIQAMRMLKKYATQSPAIGLGYIQRTVDIMNREAKAKMGKQYKEMVIDQQLADEYVNATTKDEIDAALGKIYKNLGSQVQKTTGEEITDRLRAWRYSAMLGNPRTHVRNLVGNALFVPAVTMKNAIGSALESAAKTETRTKSLTVSKAAKQFAAQDAIEMRDVLQGNADKSIRQLIMDERKTFTAPALNTFKKLNGDALEYEDWIFLRYHYQNALAQYITANKLDVDDLDGKDLAKARQYAVKEAQKATYRDANKLSTWLNQSKEAGPIRFIMEGMLPFKKTPTNILRRGIEYSPAMLVLSIKRGIVDLNQGKITTNEWIDGLASGLTGTAIFGLGMFLASTGAILGGYKDDDDKDKRKLKGEQEYAVKIGNHTYTIDWAAPSALPLFVGVETMSAFRSDGNLNFDDIAKSAAKIVDPMINMSMLSGLNDTLDAIAYSDSKLSAIGEEAFFSLLGQFVPTILGQAARTIDTTQRINYQDVNKGMPKNMLYFIEKMQNKIPYMTFSNDPYLDAFGRENTAESRFIAALQNFVSPGYISKIDDDRVVKTVTELQNNTEEKVIPKKMPKYIGQGEERIDLTSAQYTQFQRTAGQLSYNILDSMIADNRYNKLTADEQAKAIKMAYDYAKACGRIEIQPEYEAKIDGDTKKIYNAVNEGKQAYDTILTLLRGDKVTENITATEDKTKKQNTIDAIINSDLTEKEKETVFETEYDSAKLDAWKETGGRTNDFMIYSLSMGNIKGDKKKERTIQYIESLKLNEEQSKILYDVAGYEPEKFSAATIDAKIPEDTDKYLFVSQSKDWTPEQKVEWFKSDSSRTDGKKYKAWKNAGGVDYDYIKYRGDISRYDGLPKKEKKSKVTEYINSTGLNAEKKRVLWTFAGYKESTCPW